MSAGSKLVDGMLAVNKGIVASAMIQSKGGEKHVSVFKGNDLDSLQVAWRID